MPDVPAALPERPRGGPALMILLVVVIAPTFLVGQLVGAGGAAILGGFVALFTLISSMGGSARSNLRRFVVVGPLIAAGTVAPRLVAETSVALAIALATVTVLVAGLLPLRSRRYEGTALGLGMGALLGYSLPLGAVSSAQLVSAGLSGLLVAGAMLVLTGLKDPSGPTRAAAADLLVEDDTDVTAAFDAWTSDRAPRWIGTVLSSAGRYQVARRALRRSPDPDGTLTASLEAAAERAQTVAQTIRAKDPASITPAEAAAMEPSALVPVPQEEASDSAVAQMFVALEEAQSAALARDTTRADLPRGLRTRVDAWAVRAAVGHGALQVRHALRTSVAVLLALLVSLFLDPGDPLLPTLLLTTFGLIQVSWQATLARARDRFLGIVVGGALVVLVLLALPPAALFPLSMVGLAVGMWFITARPAVGTAGLIVMSVGLNTELRSLDPFEVVAEYAILAMIALLIGTVVGFLLVPSWRPPTLTVRAGTAVEATARAVRELAGQAGPASAAQSPRIIAEAYVATNQLVGDLETLDEEQQHEVDALRSGLHDILLASVYLTATRPETAGQELLRSAQALEPGTDSAPSLTEAPLVLLAQDARDRQRRLEASLG